MKTALWILLAGLLTYVSGAALHNAALSRDRESLAGNVLLSLSTGWYTVGSWRRVLIRTRGDSAPEARARADEEADQEALREVGP
ncbi:hypothetical protein ACGFS9_04595 [Streptomyces sp. NPDC048566]|uniref:hypothetical protein n=1 Tax=Streptomyces sp. NPDC048566 TaxID=3365569 RepID=UPI0037203BF9